MGELKNHIQALEELGFAVVAISPDAPEKSAELAERSDFGFPLYSDDGLAFTRKFGVVYQSGSRRLPVPAVYVIGKDGTILFHYVHPDYKVRLDPDVLMAAAKSAVK